MRQTAPSPSMQSPVRNALIFAGFFMLQALPANADWMGEYFPFFYQSYWIYENVDDPSDTYTQSVYEIVYYEGQTAVCLGQDAENHYIASNDGQTITIFGFVENGVPYDFEENPILGEFSDGSYFVVCDDAECDSSLIRVWDTIDPILREIYEIDPEWTDLVLIAAYDGNHDANPQNIVVESNLPDGITPPTGAVTDLEWYQRGVGTVANRGVDAASGNLGNYYALVEYNISTIAVPEPPPCTGLAQNFPNPFNPMTTIEYELPRGSAVSLRVYDVRGRLVKTLMALPEQPAGHYTSVWDGRDDAGLEVSSGVYVYRLEAGNEVITRRMAVIR
jgi:hypothetical protein